jgi:fucose permease
MISSTLSARLAGRDIHYGWVVAATTFLTMLATAGALGAPGVMILPLQEEFGWRTADISFALAVRLILFGIMAPFAAAFMNHFGIRQVVSVALLLIMSGLGGSLVMTEVW